jgi:hypothetical protein
MEADVDEEGWYEQGQRPEQKPSIRTTRHALRLTFQFEGDKVQLINTERLEKLVPPMIGDPPEEGHHTGEWLQVRDGDDRPIFTRLLNDPLRTRVEVHDPEEGPHIVVGPPGRGTFDVLVPDLPDAAHVVVFASPALGKARGRGLRPAEPLGRFDLRRKGNDPGTTS